MKNDYQELLALIESNRIDELMELLEGDPNPLTILFLLDHCQNAPRAASSLLNLLHQEPHAAGGVSPTARFHDPFSDILSGSAGQTEDLFLTESAPGGWRILSYTGTDEEVLIPEFIGQKPVREISKLFFLSCGPVRSLLVPEGIRIGTILPSEARKLYGAVCDMPEIVRIPAEAPSDVFGLSISEKPVSADFSETSPNEAPAETPDISSPEKLASSDTRAFPEKPASADFDNMSRPDPSEWAPGKTISFGTWAYSDSGSLRPLEWTILDWTEDRALVLLRSVPELLPFHHTRTAALWDSCDLRHWLNEDFFRAAFTEEEQGRICPAELTGTRNPSLGTRNSYSCEDRVFLLSPGEWEQYRHLFAFPLEETPWSASQKSAGPADRALRTWLRMPGMTAQYAVTADSRGDISWQGELVMASGIGFLPALWLQIEHS